MLPLAYIIIENSLSSLDTNLEDSAANLGASEGKILRSIVIPLLYPSFLKAALIVFVMAMAEFGNAAILCGRTSFLAVEAYTLIVGQADFNMASVFCVVLLLPCVVFFVVQNHLAKGSYTTVTGKPVAAEPRHISAPILMPMLIVSFILCGSILLTFGVVVAGAFTTSLGFDNTFTLANIINMESNEAITNSVKMSLLAGLFGALLGITLAYVIMRGKLRGKSILEAVALVGFGFPGPAMGIAYLLTFNSPPLLLTGTMIILVICSVIRAFVVSLETGITKLQQLHIEIEEASTNLGASIATTFKRIVFPIIFPAFIYGFIYVFVRSMISLSAVIFLVSPRFMLAAVYIFDRAIWGYIGQASATTLKLIIIVGACLAILNWLSKWTGMSATGGKGRA